MGMVMVVEINSEIRAHFPVWRQKLLNILEEVDREGKSKEKTHQNNTITLVGNLSRHRAESYDCEGN